MSFGCLALKDALMEVCCCKLRKYCQGVLRETGSAFHAPKSTINMTCCEDLFKPFASLTIQTPSSSATPVAHPLCVVYVTWQGQASKAKK